MPWRRRLGLTLTTSYHTEHALVNLFHHVVLGLFNRKCQVVGVQLLGRYLFLEGFNTQVYPLQHTVHP